MEEKSEKCHRLINNTDIKSIRQYQWNNYNMFKKIEKQHMILSLWITSEISHLIFLFFLGFSILLYLLFNYCTRGTLWRHFEEHDLLSPCLTPCGLRDKASLCLVYSCCFTCYPPTAVLVITSPVTVSQSLCSSKPSLLNDGAKA